jgi:uncharacterized NAD(P)/FAD-binding protein YdhS
MYRRVALIGGGAAAVTLLAELLERSPPHRLYLDWYAGTSTPGRGVAYGTNAPHHLLNVRAASMGLFGGHTHDFLDFARARDPGISGADFLPRRCYGDYLEDTLQRVREHAVQRGIDLHLRPLHADAVVPKTGAGVTVFSGGQSTTADAAVLALGALPPRPMAGVSDAALASGHYVVDPWRFLPGVEPDARPLQVLVIGVGLTAVDVILTLARRWPNARFVAVSRHGALPAAHRDAASAPVDDGADLLASLHDAPSARAWLHRIREACAQADDWRTVIDSLRLSTPALWQALPCDERARFLRHARWSWERVRHRMPPQVADWIAGLESTNRLQHQRGRVCAVEAAADGRLRVHVAQGSATPRSIDADRVIQTTGLDTDVRCTAHPLVRQLLTDRHVQADPFGLGLAADTDGRLRRADGEPWPQLRALGSLLRGTLWESTAMPEIRQQARRLADDLLSV